MSEYSIPSEYYFRIHHVRPRFKGDIENVKALFDPNVSETPTENLISSPDYQLKGLEHVISISNIHSNQIKALINLKDGRIATAGNDKSISVISFNVDSKEWNQDIKKENAHNSTIWSLCEIDNNRIISCSYDKNIKIWNFTKLKINLLKTLTGHSNWIGKVTPLSHNRFASCSYDKTVKIWNSSEPYQEITTLNNESYVYNIIQLKNKEILISSCDEPALIFWNLNTYVGENKIKGVYAYIYNHIIELPNECVAISQADDSNKIIIVDTVRCVIIKEIQEKNFIIGSSSLCTLNEMSFIYVLNGRIVQIWNEDYSIKYKVNIETRLIGEYGIILVGKEYLGIVNNFNGIEIVKPYYK